LEELPRFVDTIIQTAVLLVGIGIAFGVLRNDVKGQGTRLTKVELDLDKMREVMVSLARQEERYNAMDQRMLAQGQRIDTSDKRLDTVAGIINGRLEAINNIVSGHTAQLNSIHGRRSQT
jgi:hypothetical protein